ncbi:alpha-D-ribose 1-methylphosphonate 5-triphosphate diphosphatase [Pseudalkalibacillus sp. A8]|uniref:alpha-D-ribose 1-methylphosphonate 5-triphosphate diphosphatase n=1 Tax=Pseudalkalibacillus sp. A8 TaxID=3382641 RepID=UPI0038B44E91
MEQKKIYNAKIVTPDRVIQNGMVIIEEDKIVGIEEYHPTSIGPADIDAEGNWVLPGIVDSHSDAIEIELEPRPSSMFPIEISFFELEKKLVGEGITTIYHSLSLLEENAKKQIRQNHTVLKILEDINRLSQKHPLIRHKTHLRYEITNIHAAPEVEQCIERQMIDQLSFMDHTPGQGQFRDIEIQKKLLIEHRRYSEEQAHQIIESNMQKQKLEARILLKLADLAHQKGIPVASHDDDTIDKLSLVKDWNASISEFPVELDVAKKANELGIYVVMGAPNLLLGKSHSNNLSAMEAIKHDVVDGLCSDYYPASMLHAAFKLYHHGFPINVAINMVSLNPARALKLDQEVGSIEIGKKADLLIASEDQKRPVLHTVLVDGNVMCQMNYRTPVPVSIVH